MFRNWTFSAFMIMFTVLVSCSHKKAEEVKVTPEVSSESSPVPTEFPNNPRAIIKLEEIANAKTEIGPLVIDPIEVKEKINIKLSNAQIKLVASENKKQNILEIKLVQGNPNICKVKIVRSEQFLFLVENYSTNEKCKFSVDVKLFETVPVELFIGNGSVWASEWDDSIQIKMDNGDVDFENIDSLNLVCKECTVAGSGVSTDIFYEIGNGNVGIENIHGSVKGTTSGDTVLKWSKFNKGAVGTIHSKVGDIFVGIPQISQVYFDIRAPHGDVYSFIKPENIGSVEVGNKIGIHIETGNLHLGYGTSQQ